MVTPNNKSSNIHNHHFHHNLYIHTFATSPIMGETKQHKHYAD
nr:MAG TPA_asm: Aminotransferase [Caudoviricetes sp.]